MYPGEVNGVNYSEVVYELKQGDFILYLTYTVHKAAFNSPIYYLTIYWKDARLHCDSEFSTKVFLKESILQPLLDKIEKGLTYLESTNAKFFEELEKFEFEF